MSRIADRFDGLLDSVATGVLRCPWWVVGAHVALAALSVTTALAWLDVKTGQNDLVSGDVDYNRRYLRYLDEFGDQEYLFVVIDASDLARAREVADAIVVELGPLKAAGHVESCVHRLATEDLARGALLLMDPAKLERLAALTERHQDELKTFLDENRGLAGLLRVVLAGLDRGAASEAVSSNPALAELGFTALRDLLAALVGAVDGDVPQPESWDPLDALARLLERESVKAALTTGSWSELIDRDFLQQAVGRGYLYAGDHLFVLIMPEKDFETLEIIREPLREIRAALDRVRARYPKVEIGLTGRPVLQHDEMQTTNDDMKRAAVLAICIVLFLFMLFFRAVRRPLITAVVLVLAIAITFGVATAYPGHLNLLSIVFAVMLVSLGMDFGVHVIGRYQEELCETSDVYESLRVAIVTAGKGNVTGGMTTAAAFYCTLLADFQGLSELGFIAGTGVIICMVAMNTMLPALLLITDRWRPLPKTPRHLRLDSLVTATRWPISLLTFCGLALAVGAPLLARVRFDSNLLDLQAADLPSVKYEKRLTRAQGVKTWYATYLVDSLDEVRALEKRLSDDRYAAVIGKTESVLTFVPDDQDHRIAVVRRLSASLAEVGNGKGALGLPDPPSPFDLESVRTRLEELLDRLDAFLSGSLRRGDRDAGAVELLEALTNAVDGLLEKTDADRELASRRLGELERGWVAAVDQFLQKASRWLDPAPLDFDSLDPFVQNRVRSPRTGTYVVYAYPARDIWQEKNLQEFTQATREVSELVTGVPEQVYQSAVLMKEGFIRAALLSIGAVFLLVLLDFRKLLFSALAVLPVAIGLAATLELMPLLGLSLNLANFFSIPIIIGTGINGGIHILHRFREDRSAAVAASSTGRAVILSELSTIAGLGMLLTAEHRGVSSLGAMMVLGCSACLFSSVIILPAILVLVERRRYRA